MNGYINKFYDQKNSPQIILGRIVQEVLGEYEQKHQGNSIKAKYKRARQHASRPGQIAFLRLIERWANRDEHHLPTDNQIQAVRQIDVQDQGDIVLNYNQNQRLIKVSHDLHSRIAIASIIYIVEAIASETTDLGPFGVYETGKNSTLLRNILDKLGYRQEKTTERYEAFKADVNNRVLVEYFRDNCLSPLMKFIGKLEELEHTLATNEHKDLASEVGYKLGEPFGLNKVRAECN